ncbi:hypothetical protein BD414DRAFT_42050 [Trametes punicea]|nr:hypothetical protein BD414DRAFT_42050 [Trametes punicea]
MQVTALLVILLPFTDALSWAHIPFHKKGTSHEVHALAGSSTPEEVALILESSESLRKYSARPDCFRRVAATIRAACAELESHEDERVRAALSLTLCEIATAEHLSPPMECAAFQPAFEGQPPHRDRGLSGRCVEALSRSAQYWSSYSGYLREVPQLCFAFRRWNDIDTAKELHLNSTRQSLTLLRYLADRENIFEQSLNRSGMLLEEMHALLGRLHSSSSDLNRVSDNLDDQLRSVLTEVQCICARFSALIPR